MHHKKTRNASTFGSNGKGQPRSDGGHEAMARLRYLKKPLCLQYNVCSGTSKRNNYYKTKRKEPSFMLILVVGLIRLLHWIAITARKEISDFILKPADQLFSSDKSYNYFSLNNSPAGRRRRSSLSRKYLNCTKSRDFGRTARLIASAEKRAQLCYF